MEPSKAFEEMSRRCGRLQANDILKSRIRGGVNYFLAQSLCHEDRRDALFVMKAKWQELESISKGTGFFESCRKDHSIWPTILIFLNLSDPKYKPATRNLPNFNIPSKPDDPNDWDVERFTRELKICSLPDNASSAEKEMWAVITCFLVMTAKLPRKDRDMAVIKLAWKIAWRLGQKFGILEEFRQYSRLKQRWISFLQL